MGLLLPRALLSGTTTYIPVLRRILSKSTRGTDSARYCYTVWLRHLVKSFESGFTIQPENVAELGPGDSIGTGLAALLSGSTRYYAFDVVKHNDFGKSLEILDELVDLFKSRASIPGDKEFPRVKPYLDSYEFPRHILTEERLGKALNPERIDYIRKALITMGKARSGPVQISYVAPWYDDAVIQENSIDMVYSQAVLEHVDELEDTHAVLYRWLKKNGFMSHQIDFKSHGLFKEWDGHWKRRDITWKLIRGKRPYLLNRVPHSVHIELMRRAGFDIVRDEPVKEQSYASKKDLAPRFRDMLNEDRAISGVFIQAVRAT